MLVDTDISLKGWRVNNILYILLYTLYKYALNYVKAKAYDAT